MTAQEKLRQLVPKASFKKEEYERTMIRLGCRFVKATNEVLESEDDACLQWAVDKADFLLARKSETL